MFHINLVQIISETLKIKTFCQFQESSNFGSYTVYTYGILVTKEHKRLRLLKWDLYNFQFQIVSQSDFRECLSGHFLWTSYEWVSI